MAKTQITDVIVPEVFIPYHIELTAQKSKLVQSGIVVRDAQMDALASQGGKIMTMPFWQDLSGGSEVMSESAPLTPAKIVAAQDAARKQNRAKSWSTSDLAGHLAGNDPMAAIANLTASWQARDDQAILLATLAGVFADATMTDSILDIAASTGTVTSANTLTGAAFIDAQQLMGDNKELLTAIMMHSATEAYLKKLDQIEYIQDSTGTATYATFRGLRVITDDGAPLDTSDDNDVYTTYLFGQGAIALGLDSSPRPLEVGFGDHYLEYTRAPLSHEAYMIMRRWFIMHPRGVAWGEGSVAGTSPTNAELANDANWARVYERKNVRIVAVKHNII
jgi:hypothetical protein